MNRHALNRRRQHSGQMDQCEQVSIGEDFTEHFQTPLTPSHAGQPVVDERNPRLHRAATFSRIFRIIIAVLAQLYWLARTRPLRRIPSRIPVFPRTDSMAIAMAGTSSGFTSIEASPATSGIELVCAAMTGTPHAMASKMGRPKPSYREGKT